MAALRSSVVFFSNCVLVASEGEQNWNVPTVFIIVARYSQTKHLGSLILRRHPEVNDPNTYGRVGAATLSERRVVKTERRRLTIM
jgi:hypothetical protein